MSDLDILKQIMCLRECPANVRAHRWLERDRVVSFCPPFVHRRLCKWALESSFFDATGRFEYLRNGEKLEVKFNGRNGQFHALYGSQFSVGYELETALLLLRLAPRTKVFYDIGANWGYFSLLMAAAPLFNGHIYAFEPNPRTFADLKATFAQAGLEHAATPLNFGLGKEDGELSLIEEEAFETGLTRLDASGSGRRVPVKKLDSLEVEAPTLIKLDAEFMEKDILEGGARLLARHQPHIIFENFLSFEDPEITYAPMKFLEGLGYRLFNPTLRFRGLDTSVLASYGDNFGPLAQQDRNPRTLLVPITRETRFLMRRQVNIFACHESRLGAVLEEEHLELGVFV